MAGRPDSNAATGSCSDGTNPGADAKDPAPSACHPGFTPDPRKVVGATGIRTSDPLRPRQVRYQAALRQDSELLDSKPLSTQGTQRICPGCPERHELSESDILGSPTGPVDARPEPPVRVNTPSASKRSHERSESIAADVLKASG